jgi:uncharacterized OB-fold protein
MSERFFPDGMPMPMADSIGLPWWQAAAEHRLVVQRCSGCSKTRLPPAPICASCRAMDSEWQEVSGLGEVYTFTVIHRPMALDQTLPFVVAVIALEGSGGLRMISNLVGIAPEDVRIGLPVEVVWEDMSDELSVPRFRPRS